MLAGLLAAPLVFLTLAAETTKGGEAHSISVVAAAGPDDGCPSPRQVSDSLAARLPGMVLPAGQAPRPGTLRLAVIPEASGAIRVDLNDQAGASLLHRVLPPARGTAADCAALADTTALIVERYWREVGYDAPPLVTVTPPPAPPAPPPVVEESPPPPPPAAPRVYVPMRWSLAAAAAGQLGDTGTLGATALLALTFERPVATRRVGFRLSAGVGNRTTAITESGEARFRRLPVRAGAYLPIRLPLGQLEPGLGVGIDVITFGVTDNASPATQISAPGLCSGGLCASPGADVAVGWALTSARHLYVRFLTRAGVTVPYDFVNNGVNTVGEPVWSTPRTYLEAALECGLWFP